MLNLVKRIDYKKVSLVACSSCLVLCVALFAGCSSSSNSNSISSSASGSSQSVSQDGNSSSSATEKEGTIGQPIAVNAKHGDLEITVDGFETSNDMRERYSHGVTIKDGKTIGVLLIKVKNISYEDKYNEGRVSVEPSVHPVDAEGVSLDCLSSAYDYGEYSGAAGSSFECAVGQTKREALFYVVDNGITQISVLVDGVRVPVSVAAA